MGILMADDDDHDLEQVSMPKVIRLLSSVLEKVAESNDVREEGWPRTLSVFQGLRRPAISVESYLDRIFRYANCSPCCFVVAYVYLERFAHRQPSLPINSLNVHRLLITSVMVAAKFMDDLYYNNAYYARVGGISTTEMNYLELDFLFGLGFHLNVTPTTFHTYSSYLNKEKDMSILLQPPPPPPVVIASSAVHHQTSSLNFRVQYNSSCCLNDEETSHQKQQLPV